MDIFIHTNGLNLSDEIQDLIIESKVTNLCISIDAFTDETYKRLRGGSLKKLKNNILSFIEKRKKIKKKLPVVRVSFIPNEANYNEIEKFSAFWQKHVDLIEFQNVALSPDTSDENSKYIKTSFVCTDPWKRLVVQANGDVYPCCSFHTFNKGLLLGNAQHHSLRELWTGSKLSALRNELASGQFQQHRTCRVCLSS